MLFRSTEEPIAARSLMFKLNLAFKSILGLRKIQEQERKAGEKIVFRSEGKKEEPKIKIDPLKGEIAPKYKAALQLGEDIFVFKNSKPKKVGKKFIIQAEGPSPETGEWRLEPELGGEKREQQWRWVEKTEDGILAKDHENDGWILTGEKPVFNNDSQQWQFCAEKPELSYRKQGTIAGKKLETDSDRKSTRLNSSHSQQSRMPSSA